MRRREFLGVLGSAAAAWPLAARTQPAMPTVGFLASADGAHLLTGVRRGLAERGFVEGRNVVIEFREARGQYDLLLAQANDLVSRKVAVIAAIGNANAAVAARNATSTIPIVFANGGDPVQLGLVASMNRPEGNVTGVSFFNSLLIPKRLELLDQLVSRSSVVGFLMNPNTPNAGSDLARIEAAARDVGRKYVALKVSTEAEIDAVLSDLPRSGVGALLTGADSFIASRRQQIVTLVARARLPVIFNIREFPDVGGLMSYGSDILDGARQAGDYAGRILQGARPADLPILQPTKLQLVINLKTAKALDIAIPPALLARADEVIE